MTGSSPVDCRQQRPGVAAGGPTAGTPAAAAYRQPCDREDGEEVVARGKEGEGEVG